MLVFIDESGDAGFKFDRGSSPYFTVVAIMFRDSLAASACERAIAELRREQRLSAGYEFHFTHCSDRLRLSFFKKVATEEFQYHAFVLNKKRLYGSLFSDPETFYHWTVTTVCSNCGSALSDAKVVIDKCGDRRFARRLESTLKCNINHPDKERRVRKVIMQDSSENELIQLADMVCGAVRVRYGAEDQRAEFCELIRRRQLRVQTWP